MDKPKDSNSHKRELNTRRFSWKIIEQAALKNKRLSFILNRKLSKSDFANQEKRFITDLVNGTVKMSSRLDWEIDQVFNGKIESLKLNFKILLRMGAYQLRYMDSVPDYAAVTTTVQLAKKIHKNLGGLANALLRAIIKSELPKEPDASSSIDYISNFYSHPEWLIEKWIETWSYDDAVKLAKWNNLPPNIWFRVNSLCYTNLKFKNYLKKNGIEFDFFDASNLFFLPKTGIVDILGSEQFKKGLISVQNPTSGLIVMLLDPREDEVIIDGCSAPGGKTSYIAEIMNNKGKILAFDKSKSRIEKLKINLDRLSIKNVTTEIKDLTVETLPKADKILLDVPCSGTGAMSKRADLRWRRETDDLLEMHLQQRKILWEAAESIKDKGVIVYSTCSLEYEENWMVIKAFLKAFPKFKVDKADNYIPSKYVDKNGALFTFPPNHNIDGGFAVRLVKDD